MTKVYLDNNVLVDIECGKYNLSDFLSTNRIEYYYSASHIEELIEGAHLKQLSKNNRLSLIEQLTKNNYILSGFPLPIICKKKPQEVYEIENNPLSIILHKKINDSVSNDIVDRDRFLKILKKKKIDMNNILPQDILLELDKALLANIGIDLTTYLHDTNAMGRAVFGTLFNLLDYACYYKDKLTPHSDIARMYDASHAYFAQLCDYFVSQDKRMIYKTKAVYCYLGIKTAILSTSDYVELVQKG